MTDRWELLGVEWGWPFSDDRTWHARRLGAARTLCGLVVDYVRPRRTDCRHGFFPVAQAANPQPCCSACDRLVKLLAGFPPGPIGSCPVCGVWQPVDGGLLVAHGGCVGVNLPAQESL